MYCITNFLEKKRISRIYLYPHHKNLIQTQTFLTNDGCTKWTDWVMGENVLTVKRVRNACLWDLRWRLECVSWRTEMGVELWAEIVAAMGVYAC